MNIRILDYMEHPSPEGGETIFKIIKSAFDAGEPVSLSFDGIHSIASPFVSTSLVPLLDEYPLKRVKELLSIQSSNKGIDYIIQDVLNIQSKNRTKPASNHKKSII